MSLYGVSCEWMSSMHLGRHQEAGRGMDYRITSKKQLTRLWTDIYNTSGKLDWSGILPYYHQDIRFRDSVQEIHGIESFTAMTQRLEQRSKDLSMEICTSMMEGHTLFMEWIMTLRFKKYPSSSVYGCSRITLDDHGKIIEQRDYYDLWGDIFDNIPRFNRMYRRFMHKKFG